MYASTHTARLVAVRSAVDFACNELEKNKYLKVGLSEDQLTIEICQFLSALGFESRHDEQIGGHCDIVIKGKDRFLWLAEAKIHNAYDWLTKGFLQLSTRYLTGVAGQDSGEVIIYCSNRDSKNMLDLWRKILCEKNANVAVRDDPSGNPLAFWSLHKHVSSGLDFQIRHKVVTLHFAPADKSAKV